MTDPDSAPLLTAEGLEKQFGGLMALDSPDISIAEGELVGLIGPNGAGKTTFFDCVTGFVDLDAGSVYFDGTDVTNYPPYKLAQAGLVRSFQLTRELGTMTVRENIHLSAKNHPGERVLPALMQSTAATEREREVEDRAMELIEFFGLEPLIDEYAANLSGGQRKLLEVARALMLDPEILLLDEPLAGVNPTLEMKITGYIDTLNDRGKTFLIIEHELESLSNLVDRLIVMNQGRVLTEGDPDVVLDDEDVIEAYLGG